MRQEHVRRNMNVMSKSPTVEFNFSSDDELANKQSLDENEGSENGSRRRKSRDKGRTEDDISVSSESQKLLEEQRQDSEGYQEVLFMFISFGYMLPWTSLGSLISYYKYTYSANFYVKLYCCYYLPGLPVALLQHQFDGILDASYGSKNTYMLRGIFAFVCMVGILVSMLWLTKQFELILLFVMLGVCGWLCHGSACMLASMYSPSAIAYLQTGFRCPEIYTIAAVALLQIGKTATRDNLNLFYIMTANAVLIGLISWVVVVRSPRSRRFFDSKDNRLQFVDTSGEKKPLLSPDNSSNQSSQSHYSTLLEKDSDLYSSEDGEADDLEYSPSDATTDSLSSDAAGSPPGTEDKIKRPPRESLYARPLARAKKLLRAMEEATLRSSGEQAVWPLCVALIATMWCSIFQASFFAYVDSPEGRDIEQILYFVRLFSDLLGRPLTRLPRPSFLKKNYQLMVASFLRIVLMLGFFAYVLFPSMLPRSDIFITCLVGVFSVLSGYFTVLIYEYAAMGAPDKAAQTHVTAVLNICFQVAAFTAVLMSVLVTSAGWMDKYT